MNEPVSEQALRYITASVNKNEGNPVQHIIDQMMAIKNLIVLKKFSLTEKQVEWIHSKFKSLSQTRKEQLYGAKKRHNITKIIEEENKKLVFKPAINEQYNQRPLQQKTVSPERTKVTAVSGKKIASNYNPLISRDQKTTKPKVTSGQMKVSKPKAKPNSIIKTEKLVSPHNDPEDEALLNDRSESDGPEESEPTPKKQAYQMQIEQQQQPYVPPQFGQPLGLGGKSARNHINTFLPTVEEPICVLKIELDGSNYEEIKIFENDDPKLIVKEFGDRFNLSDNARQSLLEQINEQIQLDETDNY